MAIGRARRAIGGRELWGSEWPLLTGQRRRGEPEQSADTGHTRIRDGAPKLHTPPPKGSALSKARC